MTVLNNTGAVLPAAASVGPGRRWPGCGGGGGGGGSAAAAEASFDLLGVEDKTACRTRPSLCEGAGRVRLAVANARAAAVAAHRLRPAEAAAVGSPARASLLLAHQPPTQPMPSSKPLPPSLLAPRGRPSQQ